MLDHRDKIYDSLGLLANSLATAVAADAIAVIRAVAVVAGAGMIDTGGGFTDGNLVIDKAAWTEAFVAADSQRVAFTLQGSTTTTFTTQSPLAQVYMGMVSTNAATPFHIQPAFFHSTGAATDLAAAQRFVTPFNNTYGNKVYRWLRLYVSFAGTWATGVLYSAFLSK